MTPDYPKLHSDGHTSILPMNPLSRSCLGKDPASGCHLIDPSQPQTKESPKSNGLAIDRRGLRIERLTLNGRGNGTRLIELSELRVRLNQSSASPPPKERH